MNLERMVNGGAPDPVQKPSRGFDLSDGKLPVLLVVALLVFTAVASWRVHDFMSKQEERQSAIELAINGLRGDIQDLKKSFSPRVVYVDRERRKKAAN